MERRTTKEIVESMRRGTRFTCREDLEYKKADFIGPFNIDRVEYAVFLGEVEPEDFFLLEMVYDCCFTTPEFLYFRIKNGVQKGDWASVQIASSINTLGVLNEKLEKLANLGLLFCYEPVQENATKMVRIFYCSMEGFRAFTHRLEKKMIYNRSLVYRPMHDVFRFLATNVAMQAFYKSPYFKKMWNFSSYGFTKKGAKKPSYEDVYGRVLFQKSDSSRSVIVFIEPIFFRCDERFVSPADNERSIAEGIDKMRSIIESFERLDDTDAYVLFLLEDAVGMKKFENIIRQQELGFFAEYCFFTSENALFESSLAGGDGLDSLLGISVKENDFAFRQRNIPGTF